MATDQQKAFDDEWDNDEPIIDRMSIVEEGDNESSSDDSGRKDARAGASNIPFSSSGDSIHNKEAGDSEPDNTNDAPPPRHVRKNSKRLNITSSSTSFDPKRQKCQSPNRFYLDRDEPFHDLDVNLLKPLSAVITPPSSSRRKSIIQNRVRRTSSVDSFASVRFSETASESDEAHTPPQVTRSRKSSRIGATPRSVVSRCSLNDSNSIINQKFIFSPYPEDLISTPGESNEKDFAWSLKTKSTDNGLSGFFSIALDFDHKKTTNDNDENNSRKLKPLDINQQPDSAKSSFIVPKFDSDSNGHSVFSTESFSRVKSFPSTGFTTHTERMTPLLPFQDLSLN